MTLPSVTFGGELSQVEKLALPKMKKLAQAAFDDYQSGQKSGGYGSGWPFVFRFSVSHKEGEKTAQLDHLTFGAMPLDFFKGEAEVNGAILLSNRLGIPVEQQFERSTDFVAELQRNPSLCEKLARTYALEVDKELEKSRLPMKSEIKEYITSTITNPSTCLYLASKDDIFEDGIQQIYLRENREHIDKVLRTRRRVTLQDVLNLQ
jgi:hypothetical protein